MKALLLAIPVLVFTLFCSVQAAGPTDDLSEELAKRLISEIQEIQPNGINVASVVDGSKRSEDGFVETHVRRVTVVQQMLLDGRLVRRVRCYDFSWNAKYGWFHQETGENRGREEVWIWSEKAGHVIVK